MRKLFHVILVSCVVFTLLFAGFAIRSEDSMTVPVSMSPFKIILNAQCVGAQQDIQAIVSVSPAVYENIQGSIGLYFDGDESNSFTTDVFRYCYVDYNMLVSFDRLVIQEKLKELGITGITTATVTGEFTENNEVVTFIGTDSVEILSPSKK